MLLYGDGAGQDSASDLDASPNPTDTSNNELNVNAVTGVSRTCKKVPKATKLLRESQGVFNLHECFGSNCVLLDDLSFC